MLNDFLENREDLIIKATSSHDPLDVERPRNDSVLPDRPYTMSHEVEPKSIIAHKLLPSILHPYYSAVFERCILNHPIETLNNNFETIYGL